MTETSFAGRLQDVHPLTALLKPFQSRGSGVLLLKRGAAERRVYYHQGEVVQAASNLPKEALLHALEARGTIDAALRARAEEAAREGPSRPIQVLVDAGALDPDDVKGLLRRRAEQLVAACLAWKDGDVSFQPSRGMPALPSAPVKVALVRVLLAGMTRYLPAAEVEALLEPARGSRPRAVSPPPVPPTDQGFAPAQVDFLACLDGARSLEEVLNFSLLPREEAARILILLERAGFARFDAPSQAADRPRVFVVPVAEAATPGQGKAIAPPPPSTQTLERLREAPPPDEEPAGPAGRLRSGLDAQALFGQEFTQVRAPTARRPEPTASRDVEMDDVTGADLGAVRDLLPSDRQRYFEMREQIELADKRTFFERLGLGPEAGEVEIRNAYFGLAKRYHPDSLQSYAEPIRDAAGVLFAKHSEAYETLIDPEARARYIDRVVLGKPDENEQAMREVRAIIDAEQTFKRGLKFMNAGKVVDAHQNFARAVELYPQEQEYAVYLGWTTFKINWPKDPKVAEEGESLVRGALKENPKLDKGWHLLGRIAMQRENWEQAKSFLRQAIKLQPANGDAVRDYKHCEAKLARPSTGLGSPLAGLFSRFKK